MGKQWKQWHFPLGSKITVDSDCIHEIKKLLLLIKKAMTNLESVLKSRDTTLLTKVHIVKAVVFPAQFSRSVVSTSLQPYGLQHARPPCPSPNFRSLLKFMSIESVMPSNHLLLCCPLLHLPSIVSSIRVFSNESVLHITWPKNWNFSLSISPSNEYSGLISFRMD